MPQDLPQSVPVSPTAAPDEDAPWWTPRARRRLLLGVVATLCIVLLVVLPPYISVNRYQHRVAAAITGALGRPVHFDNITVHILPIPGLTIQNFVVTENADFGAEPVLRAATVEARLRVSSLWRRRIEVSHISLESPSINLVRRRADGRWNLQSILMQASQMNSAPTAQARPGPAPRFPYIEATDARINIKSGDDKLPFSVKEAEFALWLPQPDQWKLRLTGKPVRTDTDVNDVGLLRVEATLGRAADLQQAPIDLAVSWKPTQLGEAGKLTAGHDLDWRGEVSASATLRGKLGQARLVSDVHLLALRRADFFPDHTAEINAHCEAVTAGLLRSLHDLRCAVPTNNETSIFTVIDALRKLPAPSTDSDTPDDAAKPGVLLLRGEVPNVLDWRSITGTLLLKDAPANYALVWARLFSRRLPRDLDLGGTLDLSASTAPAEGKLSAWVASATCACILPARTQRPDAVKNTRAAAAPNRWSVQLRHDGTYAENATDVFSILAYPDAAHADGQTSTGVPMVPAGSVISGQVSRSGYTLRYGSPAAAQQAAAVLPPLGDGMPEDESSGMQAERAWGSPQAWTVAAAAPRKAEPRRRRRQ